MMHFREVKKTYLAYIASRAVTFVGYASTAYVAVSATSDAVSATGDFLDRHIPDVEEQSELDENDSQNSSEVKAPNTPINSAALAGNIDVIKKHIDAGTDINKRRGMGQATPLIWASTHNHKEIVELLISAGADVNIKEGNDRGWTALDAALNSFLGDGKEVADLLRKHGAKTGEELKAEGK